MYLHIGTDVIIKSDEIIGIFDLDTASVSKRTRDYLKEAEDNKRVFTVTNDLPKSFIVMQDKNPEVYLTQVSTATLKKRVTDANFIKNI